MPLISAFLSIRAQQVVVLVMLALALSEDRRCKLERREAIIADLHRLPDLAQKVQLLHTSATCSNQIWLGLGQGSTDQGVRHIGIERAEYAGA